MVIGKLIAAGMVAALACGGAAEAAPARPAALQAVMDCQKIADGTARLACYDAAVAAMAKAEASGDIVSLDRAQRSQMRRQAFGFALPSFSLFDRGEKPEAVDRIDETLASASQDAEGKWTFVMQDGAVWRQIDNEILSRDPRPGSSIVIRRAMLGSYMLSVDRQPGLRVHRDH